TSTGLSPAFAAVPPPVLPPGAGGGAPLAGGVACGCVPCEGTLDAGGPDGDGEFVCCADALNSSRQEASTPPIIPPKTPFPPIKRQPSSRWSRSVAPSSQVTPVGVQAAREIGMLAERPSAKTTSDRK